MSWLEVLGMGLIAGIGSCVLWVLTPLLVCRGRRDAQRLSAAGRRPAHPQHPCASASCTREREGR